MYSEKLSPVIDIKECCNTEDILEVTYNNFQNNIMDKKKRPNLFNKFIFIDFKYWIENKAEIYWHIISLGINEKFNVFPCNNDISSVYKKDNCINQEYQVTLANGSVRNICLYRAIRINWLIDIIHLANKNDESIKYWVKSGKLYLRFQHRGVDYAVVFQIQEDKYRLVSAFPVFYINKKQVFDKDYSDYQKIKKR
ncbi:hypothetical protein [Clostridium felsineum]|uniref:hypothetical protein n=1 Tax=Clostridium felsineum TaxID=36839 RepID=UPI00098C4341|nr:hypothetical protein [Clostridium felsineum]URZ02727.1 hypothetical protein CLAUR_027510 [Clostridium felsineum]